jgi:hypothetical protein
LIRQNRKVKLRLLFYGNFTLSGFSEYRRQLCRAKHII